MSIRIDANTNTITFKTESGKSVLDFSGQHITFSGTMSEAAKEFMDLIDEKYIKRVEMEVNRQIKEQQNEFS
jgi:hypothetical protein